MATEDFDFGQQITAENLVRLLLHTPNCRRFQVEAVAWAKVHGATPSTVMADDGAVEAVAADLSGPAPGVDDGPQGADGADGDFTAPA